MTGFLLCGVGNVDARKKTNYLVVDSSALSHSAACDYAMRLSPC